MLKYSTRVCSATTDAPCEKGWKSPQMWALVSSWWKSTGSACDSSLCFSKSPPLPVSRLHSGRWAGVTRSRVAVCTGLCWSALSCQDYHSAGSFLLNSFPDSTGNDGRGWARAKACLDPALLYTGGSSRVVLWGQWIETLRSQQATPVFVGKTSNLTFT